MAQAVRPLSQTMDERRDRVRPPVGARTQAVWSALDVWVEGQAVHLALPVPVEMKPVAQVTQPSPVGEEVPAGQTVQALLTRPEPTSHEVSPQYVAPIRKEKRQMSHRMLPVVSVKVWMGQRIGTMPPGAGLNDPAGVGVQGTLPPGEYEPAGQIEHAPFLIPVPGRHDAEPH